MDLFFKHKGKTYRVTVEDRGEAMEVRVGGKAYEVRPWLLSDTLLCLDVDGRVQTAYVVETQDKAHVAVRGKVYVLERLEATAFGRTGTEGPPEEKVVRAPMPGQVVKIDVKEGERVRKNQVLGAVEAMKMEHEIRAPRDGVVKKVYVQPGQLVEAEEALVEVEGD